MDTLTNIGISLLIFIFLLGLIVFLHELGHFLAAKRVGVLVQEFAFGFGPKLFGKKYKGTFYKINLVPLGGYVKMLGDQDGSGFLRYRLKKSEPQDKEFALSLIKKNKINLQTKDFTIIETFLNEQAKSLSKKDYQKLQNYIYYDFIPKHKGNFDNKTKKQQAFVILAGVCMNYILAVFLFYIFFIGNNYITDVKKLGDPMILGADVSSPVILDEIFGTDNNLASMSVIRKLNGRLLRSREEYMKLLSENYNVPIETTFQRYIDDDQNNKELPLILNGDGVKSSLDEDVLGSIVIGEVKEGSLAEGLGLKRGNYLTEIIGQRIDKGTIISDILIENSGTNIKMSYVDNSGIVKEIEFVVPPVTDNNVVLGISYGYNEPFYDDVLHIDYTGHKFTSGISHTINMTLYNFSGLSELIKQSINERSINPVSQGISSPVGVSGIVYTLVKVKDYANIINLSALVSLSLAVMNVLPIPLFDGGHIFFMIIEKIRGKKLSDKTQERIASITFYSIIILSILIISKDIIQFEFTNKIFNLFSGIFK